MLDKEICMKCWRNTHDDGLSDDDLWWGGMMNCKILIEKGKRNPLNITDEPPEICLYKFEQIVLGQNVERESV